MKPKTAIFLNIAAAIAWVWMGSYAYEKLDGTWAHFPTFFTTLMMGIINFAAAGGYAATLIAYSEKGRDHERE